MGKIHAVSDLADAKARFVRLLVFETRSDLANLDASHFTTYHRGLIDKELALRTKIRSGFEQLVNIQRASRSIQVP